MDDMTDDPATSRPTPGQGKQQKPRAMDKEGAVGKQFTEEGAIGGTAHKVGGPFSKEGKIGKHFTTEGSIGGNVEDKMGGTKKTRHIDRSELYGGFGV
ncbi:hypothetical protein VUR80DRAFT_9333 [Thermomyces stellatus]